MIDWIWEHKWTAAWTAWGAIFFAIEIPAVLDDRPGGTLSEHVWDFLAVGKRLTWWVRIRRILMLSFLAWLVAHFLTRWV